MAHRKGIFRKVDFNEFTKEEAKCYYALDYLRRYDYHDFLDVLDLPKTLKSDLEELITEPRHYEDDPVLFKENMAKIADFLESKGY